MFVYSLADVDRVLALVDSGLSDRAVAGATGIPRTTVQHWRRTRRDLRVRVPPTDWTPPDVESYCYVLGLYLGDGHLAPGKTSGSVRLYLDELYGEIIAAARGNLEVTF